MSDQSDDPLADWKQTPYGRGCTDAYEGRRECPYPPGSAEAKEWWDGFGDCTDNMINDV